MTGKSKILVPPRKPVFGFGEALKHTRRIIRGALDTYDTDICVAWSTGKDSTCVLHEVLKEWPEVPVYFVDAHEFPETYEYLKWAEKAWKLNLRIIRQQAVWIGGDTYYTFKDLTPDVLYARASRDFPNVNKNLLWWTVMKTFPLQEQVVEKAMFTGMRWDEDIWRGFLHYEERFEDAGALEKGRCRARVHPWLHFSEHDSHQFLFTHGIKRNPLYDKGYRSIGDLYTTSRGDGSSERSGRNQDLETIVFMASMGYLQSVGARKQDNLLGPV